LSLATANGEANAAERSCIHCRVFLPPQPAMKAGIGATACSVLIVALALLAMQILPISIG